MEQLLEIIKYIIPAVIVLVVVYLMVKSFLNKEFEKSLMNIRHKNQEIVLPVRLQAYERICLFLERISPNNIVFRVRSSEDSVGVFQQKMLNEIREEFSHNLSQQVYMSHQSWVLTKQAMENVITLINTSASKLDKNNATSIDLAKAILEEVIQKNEDPVSDALKFIKKEIQEIF